MKTFTKHANLFKNRSRTISVFFIVALFAIFHATTAFAHKVNIFAYVDDGKVFTESYFANGGACVNSEITVFDGEGRELLTGTTDDKGLFSFDAPEQTDLKIVLNAGMGHRAEYSLSKSEFSPVPDNNAPEEHSNEKQGASPGKIAVGVGCIICLAGLWTLFLNKRKKRKD